MEILGVAITILTVVLAVLSWKNGKWMKNTINSIHLESEKRHRDIIELGEKRHKDMTELDEKRHKDMTELDEKRHKDMTELSSKHHNEVLTILDRLSQSQAEITKTQIELSRVITRGFAEVLVEMRKPNKT